MKLSSVVYAALVSTSADCASGAFAVFGATIQATTRAANDANARNSTRSSFLDLVRGFAVLRRVEAEDLLVLRNAQPDEDVDDLEDHERHDR